VGEVAPNPAAPLLFHDAPGARIGDPRPVTRERAYLARNGVKPPASHQGIVEQRVAHQVFQFLALSPFEQPYLSRDFVCLGYGPGGRLGGGVGGELN
jgi:hypothetical protein